MNLFFDGEFILIGDGFKLDGGSESLLHWLIRLIFSFLEFILFIGFTAFTLYLCLALVRGFFVYIDRIETKTIMQGIKSDLLSIKSLCKTMRVWFGYFSTKIKLKKMGAQETKNSIENTKENIKEGDI